MDEHVINKTSKFKRKEGCDGKISKDLMSLKADNLNTLSNQPDIRVLMRMLNHFAFYESASSLCTVCHYILMLMKY